MSSQPAIIQVHYAKLEAIAQRFDTQGESIDALLSRLESSSHNLRAGGWIGEGADAFFAEMSSELLPAIMRLAAALYEAARVARQIALLMGEAEAEAAALFDGGTISKEVTAYTYDPPPSHIVTRIEKGTPIPPPYVVIINGINSAGNVDSQGNPTHADDQSIALEEMLVANGYDRSQILSVDAIFEEPLKGDLRGTQLEGTHFGGLASFVDLHTWRIANDINSITAGAAITINLLSPLINSAWGSAEVVNEYVLGDQGYYTNVVYEQLKLKLDENELLPGQSILIIGHSGGGAVAANLVGKVERELGYDVSGLVTLGSPVANYDEAARYAERIIDVRHAQDVYGTPIIRSEESRWGIAYSFIPKIPDFFLPLHYNPVLTFHGIERDGRLNSPHDNITYYTSTIPVDGASEAHLSYMHHRMVSKDLAYLLQSDFPEMNLIDVYPVNLYSGGSGGFR